MKVKVRKILLCVFFALFIVTLFTASFSLGRYSSVQSSESNYDDDFEYTLYDSIVVNTIDEFFAAISNGYNYIIIGDAIKDPLIIAGSMSDIRDDLIIDLNGHEIQRNSRDPLLNVTTGFTLTIIDSEGTGSMYNPVGSVIQVSGGTLTVQNGIFESGPRSDNSRDAKRHNDVNVNDYNEYVKDTPDDDELYSTPGGGSIRDTDTVTVYRNSNIGSENTSNTYGDSIGTVALPIITPKATGRGVVNGSMYFDDVKDQANYYSFTDNQGVVYDIIKDDTYLYYTFESDNMQYSTAADKSTANYYYQYYVKGGTLEADGSYPTDYFNYVGTEREETDDIRVTVYVFNDVKYYADEQSRYTDSSGTSGFAAVKMQSGNLYVRGGTYYSYFGKDNTFGVQSTGGLMTVNPTGSNAINFYAYQNGVCVECTVDKPTENEMLNISSGKFYSELGDTVRVKNGSLTIGTADFTKDVGNADASDFGDNGNVIDISGGTLTINTRAGFDVSGSGVRGIYSHKGDAETRVTVTNATFTFNGTNNLHHNCGIYAEDGNVSCRGNTTINLSNGSEHNTGIYSAGNGYIAFGIPTSNGSVPKTKIDVAIRTSDTNYGIYSAGGSIYGYGQTTITLGSVGTQSTDSEGIHSEGGTINLGRAYTFTNGVSIAEGSTTITVNGDSSSLSNFGIQTIGGTINVFGNTEITVYGKSSTGVYSTVDDYDVTTKIVDNEEISIATGGNISISGKQFTCNVNMHWQGENDSIDYANNLSSTAISSAGGNIEINSDQVTINSDGLGITAFNRRMDANGRPINENLFNEVTDESNNTTSYIGTGNVDFEGENVDLTTVRGTAIYILGGALSTSTNSTIDVTSTIVDNLPWQGESGDPYSYDGIYVQSGSLTSYGTLNVKHVGVENDSVILDDGDNGTESDPVNTAGNNAHINAQRSYDDGNAQFSSDRLPIYNSTNAYYEFAIKSYAIRVEGSSYIEDNVTKYTSNVTIDSGNITNSVGGGVYVSGGNVTLGQLGTSGPSITTTGTEAFNEYFHVTDAATNWSARLPRTGGHAVQVTGGKLTINSGTYSATLGNGILLTNGNITVNDGTIVGGDHTYNSSQSSYDPCGAAASYCLKVCGGTIEIDGGTFGSPTGTAQNALVSSSGAFIMGTTINSEDGTTTINRGTATITNGTFNVGGQAAFAVYQYATVEFDEQGENDEIYVRGLAAGLTVESTGTRTADSGRAPTVTIYDGEFRGFRESAADGIWFGNRFATLNIYGGEFIGESINGNRPGRSGLYINCNTGYSSIQNINIYGGIFQGEGDYSAIIVDGNASGMPVRNILGGRNVDDYTFYSNAGDETFNVYYNDRWNGTSTITQNRFAGGVMSYIRIVQNSTTN